MPFKDETFDTRIPADLRKPTNSHRKVGSSYEGTGSNCPSRQSRLSDGFRIGSAGTISADELSGLCSSRRDVSGAGGDSRGNTPVGKRGRAVIIGVDEAAIDPENVDCEAVQEQFLKCVGEVHEMQARATDRMRKNMEELKRIEAQGRDDENLARMKEEEAILLRAKKALYDSFIKDQTKKLESETIRKLENEAQNTNLRKQRVRAEKKAAIVAMETETLNIPKETRGEYNSACMAMHVQMDRQKVMTEKIDWHEKRLANIKNTNVNSGGYESGGGEAQESSPSTMNKKTSPLDLSLPLEGIKKRKSRARNDATSPPLLHRRPCVQDVITEQGKGERQRRLDRQIDDNFGMRPAGLLPRIPGAFRPVDGNGADAKAPRPPLANAKTAVSLPELAGGTTCLVTRERQIHYRQAAANDGSLPHLQADRPRPKEKMDISRMASIMKENARTTTPVFVPCILKKHPPHYVAPLVSVEDGPYNEVPPEIVHIPHPPKEPKSTKSKRRMGGKRKY